MHFTTGDNVTSRSQLQAGDLGSQGQIWPHFQLYNTPRHPLFAVSKYVWCIDIAHKRATEPASLSHFWDIVLNFFGARLSGAVGTRRIYLLRNRWLSISSRTAAFRGQFLGYRAILSALIRLRPHRVQSGVTCSGNTSRRIDVLRSRRDGCGKKTQQTWISSSVVLLNYTSIRWNNDNLPQCI